ncbi:DNA-binding response regulator [Chryseomicrobium excrementi]|uniref:DNA-binding response regulator n=1 Tax=Chryseomicrobium excrementi TaxID=2041346 RepID=A0A2M9F3S7_9BACL|nr:response regulator transcription factor [Chryseomicrobium excrementi]PJK18095.1 DNA-binding response regulator [Chryseomicrobium excrementi]
MDKHRIYIVEDDRKIAEMLAGMLAKYQYDTKIVEDFDAISNEAQEWDPHLILLDINLPTYDGYFWCRELRQVTTCPIIFVSARTSEMDQVFAIENGGDDYITKPFHYEIVLAKIKSHIRRSFGEYALKQEERTVKLGKHTLYMERLELESRGTLIPLQKKECVILELLFSQHPKVVSREQLLEELWDDQSFVDENTLNVNMTRVRKKLQDYEILSSIETVRGAGYRFLLHPEEA